MVNIPSHKGMASKYRYRANLKTQHMAKGLNKLPSIKTLNTLPDLKMHAYWSEAFLYRFSFYLTFKFWSQILHCKMNFIVSFVSFIVEINKLQRFSFFWITFRIYTQNIYTFGINQEIVTDVCYNRGRSKLLIVSKYRIRTCLLVYFSSVSATLSVLWLITTVTNKYQ